MEGETTAEDLATAILRPAEERHPRISRLRARSQFTALALYDPEGQLVVWDGIHQGTVPDEVRTGTVPYAYRPLFSHLYFTEPLQGGRGTAVVAALLRSDLSPALGEDRKDFASRIRRVTGEELRISRAEQAAGEGIWDLQMGEETLFSVAVERPSEAERLERVRERWARIVGALVLAGWVVLALGGRGAPGHAAAAAAALAGLGLLLPLGSVLRAPALFAPGASCSPARSTSLRSGAGRGPRRRVRRRVDRRPGPGAAPRVGGGRRGRGSSSPRSARS